MLCLNHDQAASSFWPSTRRTPAMTSGMDSEPFRALQFFSADWASLNTIIRQAVREPLPLVLAVRSRTVANVDSIGFVVRMCIQ